MEETGQYLGETPGFSVRESHDLDHYRAQPGHWSVEVTQLARGRFGSRIRSIELPGLISYHNQWACPALIQGQSPEGWLMMGGIIDPEQATVTWCGRRLDDQYFAATGDSQDITFNVENHANNVVVLMAPALLERAVGEEAVEKLRGAKHMQFGPTGPRLLTTVMELLARAEAYPQSLESPAVASRVTAMLMTGVEECFEALALSRVESVSVSRAELVHRGIQHFRKFGESTSAWEMSQAVGVSQKTMELAFREILQTTPGKYLVVHRLNAAHHRLALAEKESTTVTDVAMSLGFTHMGRFSVAYRKLFGEMPSETLAHCSH